MICCFFFPEGEAAYKSQQRLSKLSLESKQERMPLPPEALVDALQDRVHKELGGRDAKTF